MSEDIEVEVEADGRILRVGGDVFVPDQIKHIIVNQDTNPDDEWAGSVVVETITYAKSDYVYSSNQVQIDVTQDSMLDAVQEFSEANNISITSTHLSNSEFHDMFWAL